jgi:drug/metabolite transporter (DMT)-like permease
VSEGGRVLPTICMVMIPINGACIMLSLRSMRAMNEMTLAAYIVLAMFVVYLPFSMAGQGFDFLAMFDWIDWSVCGLLGFVSVFLQIARALSTKYEEPAKVAVLNYFQPII